MLDKYVNKHLIARSSFIAKEKKKKETFWLDSTSGKKSDNSLESLCKLPACCHICK